MSHLERLGLLDLLERIAKGIVAAVGPHCEVVIHDFSDLEHSAVVVAGNVSGRIPGAPVSDLDFVSNELDIYTPDQLNYRIEVDSRQLQSSMIWIRDHDGTPVGAICINIDYFELNQAYTILDRYTAQARKDANQGVQVTIAKNMDDLIRHVVSDYLRQEGISAVEAMTQDDKQRLVEAVEKRCLFKIRGASKHLADLLNISRASIYNYRANVKEKSESEKLSSS
jgi:predicted transcriptional regulator YheO